MYAQPWLCVALQIKLSNVPFDFRPVAHLSSFAVLTLCHWKIPIGKVCSHYSGFFCCSYSDLIHSSFFHLFFPSARHYAGLLWLCHTACNSMCCFCRLLLLCAWEKDCYSCSILDALLCPWGQSTVLYPEVSVWLENSDTFIDNSFFVAFPIAPHWFFFATALNHKQVFYIVSESFLKPENTVLTPKKKKIVLIFSPTIPSPLVK